MKYACLSLIMILTACGGHIESFQEISSLKKWAREGIWIYYSIPLYGNGETNGKKK